MSQKMNKHVLRAFKSESWKAAILQQEYGSWMSHESLEEILRIISGHLQSGGMVKKGRKSLQDIEQELRARGYLPLTKDLERLLKQFSRLGAYANEPSEKVRRGYLKKKEEEYFTVQLLEQEQAAEHPLSSPQEEQTPHPPQKEAPVPETVAIHITLEQALRIEGHLKELGDEVDHLQERLRKEAKQQVKLRKEKEELHATLQNFEKRLQEHQNTVTAEREAMEATLATLRQDLDTISAQLQQERQEHQKTKEEVIQRAAKSPLAIDDLL